MNKKHYLLLTISFFFMISFELNAQEKIVLGVVTTFDSIPLNGASIKVNSTKQVVKTDQSGNFMVRCNDEDKLKITAKGFFSEKVELSGNIKYAAINLKLRPGQKNRDYAIGYGYVSDANKLNSIVGLNDREVDFSRYQNMDELIRGKFAGVQIVNNEIVVRGMAAVGAAGYSNVGALVVINGVTRPGYTLWTLSPTQIKSINIIKDGSAAVYGVNGANGVVVIETK